MLFGMLSVKEDMNVQYPAVARQYQKVIVPHVSSGESSI
ncbi:hypothetical protein GcM3_137016 [Golovinomyces cichoracearum]|uniref:Uncharacterized protein n=1 Tax=Golovinomyces cichoracearum TaxID=62708 RepID=A0A420I1S9_9PEZI|nr:hypothetical protein GcM3_137016 [Golovinomyces cichoracearum]